MTRTILLTLAFPLLLGACGDNEPLYFDDVPPFAPVGIATISLDNAVELQWIANQESDLAGYNIYVSSSYNGRYSLIGSSTTTRFVDRGARNGVTVYYAVAAYDFSGNESDLSRDVAYDTPRPEGRSQVLIDRMADPLRAGYDFSTYRVIHYDTDQTDVYFERTNTGVPYLVVWEDSDIQDMGHTRDLDAISVAPDAGWNPTKDALAVAGHTYVIWTYDNHFAKMRITSITPTTITFDWAYQTATGNPELLRGVERQVSKTAPRTRHIARGIHTPTPDRASR